MVSWFSELIQNQSSLILTVGTLSLVSFAGTLLLLPILLVRIPEDYFLDSYKRHRRGGAVNILFHICKNLLGVLFLLMGFIMLFIPGQGLLTILAGLWMMDFPGKRKLETRLIRNHSIHRGIDFIRRKAGRASLRIP